MNISSRISVTLVGAIVVTVAVALGVERHIVRQQGINLTHDSMESAVDEGEDIRDTISLLRNKAAFDEGKLLADLKTAGDLHKSTLYDTIPIVAEITSVEKFAKDEGYQFRVVNDKARNPEYLPRGDEAKILSELESGKKEIFEVDSSSDSIVYARAIAVTRDCLVCHGDPATSLSGDGNDVFGIPMEGWKEGEIHGALILRSSMAPIEKVERASIIDTLALILPIGAGIAVGAFLLMRRKVVRPLLESIGLIRRSSEATAAAAAEISAASESLANGASEQAASLEETSATIEEMSAQTRSNAEHAATALTVAESANKMAVQGSEHMRRTVEAMAQIESAGNSITSIIKTIDDIAFQTNILALNAAVEAARAGEAGAGFAIVAEQVRMLAQRSATAARESAEHIEESKKRSQAGVAVSRQASETFEQIRKKAAELDELVRLIASASQEQRDAIGQLNIAQAQLDQVAQTNAASAEESAAASAHLSGQAGTLEQALENLQHIVGGASGKEASKAAPPASAFKGAKPGTVRVAPKKSATLKPPARHLQPAFHGANGNRSNLLLDDDEHDSTPFFGE